MSRVSRLVFGPVVVAVIAAGLVIAADPASAQPPGFGKGKGFQKDKGFPKDKAFPKEQGFPKQKDGEKRGEANERAEALKRLEAELDRVKAHEAELQAKMRELRGEVRGGERPNQFDRDGRGGPMGGFGRGGPGGFGRGGPGGPGGPGGFGRGPMGGFGGPPFARGVGPAFGPERFEQMSPDQIRETIGQLQRVLEEKTRGGQGGERHGEAQDALMKRLDTLTKEIEEIRRALRK